MYNYMATYIQTYNDEVDKIQYCTDQNTVTIKKSWVFDIKKILYLVMFCVVCQNVGYNNVIISPLQLLPFSYIVSTLYF